MPVIRDQKSASEIQAEVTRVLRGKLEADWPRVKVPRPELLHKVDTAGCNWQMRYWGGTAGVVGRCAEAMLDVQSRWNLSPEIAVAAS